MAQPLKNSGKVQEKATEGIDDVDEEALFEINFVLTGIFEGITRE